MTGRYRRFQRCPPPLPSPVHHGSLEERAAPTLTTVTVTGERPGPTYYTDQRRSRLTHWAAVHMRWSFTYKYSQIRVLLEKDRGIHAELNQNKLIPTRRFCPVSSIVSGYLTHHWQGGGGNDLTDRDRFFQCPWFSFPANQQESSSAVFQNFKMARHGYKSTKHHPHSTPRGGGLPYGFHMGTWTWTS